MRQLLIVALVLLSTMAKAQNLLGKVTYDSLQKKPFSTWAQANEIGYTPVAKTIAAINKALPKDIKVQIFFGTWCGDSKREVPRFMAIWKALGRPLTDVELIAVGDEDPYNRLSPGGETKGQAIYRVPTFIVKQAGKELGRIIEQPFRSLEADLLNIATGKGHQTNYASYAVIRQWSQDGTLADSNMNAAGLSTTLRPLVQSTGEINAAANALEREGSKREALMLRRINAYLYPENKAMRLAVAEAYLGLGYADKAKAVLKALVSNELVSEEAKEAFDLLNTKFK